MDLILFIIFALFAVASALGLILQTHPVNSALSLIGVMVSLAILYLLLGAEFIAAAQLVVYAGAIMVLFLFVIMLLNAGEESNPWKAPVVAYIGGPVAIIIMGMFVYLINYTLPKMDAVSFGKFTGGGPKEVGMAIFTKYLLPFEVTSVLILIAIVGAMVLARKEID